MFFNTKLKSIAPKSVFITIFTGEKDLKANMNMGNTLRKYTLDEIYISVLTGKRVSNEEGWTKIQPVGQCACPSGSCILDAVVEALHGSRLRGKSQLARLLGVSANDLNGAVHLLTELRLVDFIEQYRLMQAKEYLGCTGLATEEIARRCGFESTAAFYRMFRLLAGMSAGDYRREHRPDNYQELYTWK